MALVRRQTPAVSAPIPSAASKEGKKRVLYVEDDDLNYEVLELLLQSDYQLVRASNAAQAMALISYQVFDYLLLDVQLSGSNMNGLEIAQAVQAVYASIDSRNTNGKPKARPKIIMLTASNLTEGPTPLPGNLLVLRKPVDLPGLLKAMAA